MMELKPCPFCGGKVNFAYDIQLLPNGIRCGRCHILVRFCNVEPPGPHELFERTMNEIAEAWNRRTKG